MTWSDVRANKIAAEYLRGDKVADIAARHGVDERTVRRIRTKLNVPARLPGRTHDGSLRETERRQNETTGPATGNP